MAALPEASAITIRYRKTIKKPRITFKPPQITIRLPEIRIDPKKPVNLKAGQEILDGAGRVVYKVQKAGEELTETAVFGGETILAAVEDPQRIVKHPLKLATLGYVMTYRMQVTGLDLATGVVDEVPGGGYILDQSQQTFGEGLYWAGARLAEQKEFLSTTGDIVADIHDFGTSSSLNIFREVVGTAAEPLGDVSQEKLDKLVNGAKGRLSTITHSLFDVPASGAENLGKLMQFLGLNLARSAPGFPAPIKNPSAIPERADACVFLSHRFMEHAVIGLTGTAIRFGNKPADAGSIVAKYCQLTARPDFNSLFLDIQDAQIGKNLTAGILLRTSLHARRMVVQVLPQALKSKEGEWVGALQLRVLYLDVDQIPERVDELLACILNDTVFKLPIVSEDIDPIVRLATELRFADRRNAPEVKREIAVDIQQVGVRVTGQGLQLTIAQ